MSYVRTQEMASSFKRDRNTNEVRDSTIEFSKACNENEDSRRKRLVDYTKEGKEMLIAGETASRYTLFAASHTTGKTTRYVQGGLKRRQTENDLPILLHKQNSSVQSGFPSLTCVERQPSMEEEKEARVAFFLKIPSKQSRKSRRAKAANYSEIQELFESKRSRSGSTTGSSGIDNSGSSRSHSYSKKPLQIVKLMLKSCSPDVPQEEGRRGTCRSGAATAA